MVQSPLVLWESSTQKIMINPQLNYLFYYKGCFCPPHMGHFKLVEQYLSYPNVKMIIHQMGSLRHGVVYDINKKIFECYIEELLPKERVKLIKFSKNNPDIFLRNPWFYATDVIVILRGNEYNNRIEKEKSIMTRYKNQINYCHLYNKDIIFYFNIRIPNSSASEFIENLIKYKNNMIQINDLYKYLPEKLSEDKKKYIIHMLLDYPLK